MHTKGIQLMMGIKLADGRNVVICMIDHKDPT
jgi:hypothetical protein